MRVRLLVALVAIIVGVIAVNQFMPRSTPVQSETLGQRADRECAGKPDANWCRDQILLRHALTR